MKLNINILAFLTFLFSMVLSCSSDETKEIGEEDDTFHLIIDTLNQNLLKIDSLEENSESAEIIKKVIIESKYICPLGDKEGNSDKEGICPVCEMELIENPDYNSNK